MTIFLSNRTRKRFLVVVVSLTFFIMSINSSGEAASFGCGMDTAVVVTFVVATVSFVVVVVTVVVGIATVSGAAIVVFDSIRAVLGWVGGAVPKEDVESTILSHAVRISSELSALFHLKVPTIPMSTRLPAKKLETAVDEPVAVVVVDAAVALAAAVAAAETTILVVSTKVVGSRSNGSPNDRDVVHRAVVGAVVVNATTADDPTQHPKNSTDRHNATLLYPAVTIVMTMIIIIAAAVVVAVNVEKRGFG